MARPTAWAMAYQSLATLKYETWVDAHVLNFQLQSQWYAVQGRTHVRYVDLFSAIPSVSFGIHSLPEDQEIHLFQQHHLFNSLPVDPFVPIVFVVMQTNHFFVVVFEYQAGSAWVLGRCITDVPETPYPYCRDLHDDWTMWNGPFYWTHIAALHGYDAIDPDQVHVQAYNWAQNGFDCGPIASFVMESLMSNSLHGTHQNAVHIPPIPCGHHLRLQMLAMDYCYLSTTALPPGDIWLQWDDTEAVSEETITEITNEVAGEQHASIIHELNVVGANCLACQRINSKAQEHSPTSLDNDLLNDDNLEEDQPPLDAKSQRLRDLLRHYPYTGRARARDFLPPRAVHGIKILEEPSMRGPLEVITGQKNVKDWAATSMLHFPRPTLPVYLPAYQGHRWKPFDRTYDEYEGGPILESLHQDHNPYEIVKEPYYRPGIWSSFRDYGYHLLSSFMGVPNDYDSSCQIRDHVTGDYSLGQGCSAPRVLVEDVVILSASQMIEIGIADSNDLLDTFVHGQHRDECHICLNLELDHVILTSEDMEVTMDIDSLIWITCSLYFCTPLAVYLGPILEEKAPMHKNNHVYIDILIPQSEADAYAMGGRTEWLTMSFPLSGIPHTTFGALSSTSGTMQVYICFPRMIHRDEVTHRCANQIPKEVLDFFWEHILLPAIREHADVGSAPYVSLTLDEVRFKARKGCRKKPGHPKAVPFSMRVLQQVQSTMEKIIQKDPSRLANYGSFFFVLECKGIKLWTKTFLFQEEKSPIHALLDAIPSLDWSYMVDRNNGELLVDLGIGIHPTCDEKMVGLWRLDALEASFGAGGFLQGNIHHTCTLGRYGGIQAEMSQERGRQVHVAFRSAYNLAYEVIRPNDNLPTFVMDKDAYALNRDFMQECTQAINMYSGEAKQRSYVVRDEYRISGMAAEQVMSELSSRVQKFLLSDPILWIRSEVWFEFLAQHIKALQIAQTLIKKLDPPNLGILTGIICHMIRCTSTTPIILDHHIRESLALLQYSRRTPHLDAVQQHDDLEVLKLMQAKSRKRNERLTLPRVPLIDDDEQFPIGNMPTWSRLVKTIQLVGKLFVQFTCQIWIQMDEAWLTDPQQRLEPTSLQDAIQCWTPNHTFKALQACTFKACNAEIPGSPLVGRRQPSFSERANIFFPDPEGERPAQRSPWSVFWMKPGYIWEYHRSMKERNLLDRLEIDHGLQKIFSLLQTLPDSTKGTAKTPGKTWSVDGDKVILVTNPKFYKIKGISTAKEQHQTRRKTSRVLKPRKKLQMDLMEHAGYEELLASKMISMERQRLQQARKKRSGRAKNAHQPPTKRGVAFDKIGGRKKKVTKELEKKQNELTDGEITNNSEDEQGDEQDKSTDNTDIEQEEE
ncbi:hypothetical protein J3A83DRAFT_4376894 [Scleroderma citrinum]